VLEDAICIRSQRRTELRSGALDREFIRVKSCMANKADYAHNVEVVVQLASAPPDIAYVDFPVHMSRSTPLDAFPHSIVALLFIIRLFLVVLR
jgi:hypothetical protein